MDQENAGLGGKADTLPGKAPPDAADLGQVIGQDLAVRELFDPGLKGGLFARA